MFRRSALYHPYKPPAPLSPAGFRFGHYVPRRCFNLFQGPDFTNTRSPDPSPFSSPVRGARHPVDDDAPPTTRLADLFGDCFGSPKRPSTPTADHREDAKPNAGPAKAPLPNVPRRKGRGPKHLTFTKVARRSSVIPPHRRCQQLKDKRDAARRRLFRVHTHERRVARACDEISRLQREAETLMKPEHMDDQDRIFLEQLGHLQLDHKLTHDLEACRQRIARAAAETEERRREHEARDREAERLWGEKQDEEAREEQKKKVNGLSARAKGEKREARRRRAEEEAMRADEERQRAHEAEERRIRQEQEHLFREELARNAWEEKERQRQEELERRLREETERHFREWEERERQLREQQRMLREEVERLRRAEREHRQREEEERKLREEVERLRREERERRAREEQERQGRSNAEQAHRSTQDEQIRQYFTMYEAKWHELRTSNSTPPIHVQEMPWPVLGVIYSADQITYQDVRTFLFHPLRPGVEGKTARDKVKSEVLRFHPDKFNTRIVPKIESSQQAVAQEIAGAVARILTTIMAEEVEQQK
ncbi:hypothetical protein OG21DRAFT_812174 [Imleria badia]|nr:hypothetical protein OG21DRAFT_812174 [Imleria badia]